MAALVLYQVWDFGIDRCSLKWTHLYRDPGEARDALSSISRQGPFWLQVIFRQGPFWLWVIFRQEVLLLGH